MYNKIDFVKVTFLLKTGWDMGQVIIGMGMEKEALEDAVPVCITSGQLRYIYDKSASIDI